MRVIPEALPRVLIHSCFIVLTLAVIFKSLTLISALPHLAKPQPLIDGWSRGDFLKFGILFDLLVLGCLSGFKSETLRLFTIATACGAFVGYRVVLWLFDPHAPCDCMGDIHRFLPISQLAVERFLTLFSIVGFVSGNILLLILRNKNPAGVLRPAEISKGILVMALLSTLLGESVHGQSYSARGSMELTYPRIGNRQASYMEAEFQIGYLDGMWNIRVERKSWIHEGKSVSPEQYPDYEEAFSDGTNVYYFRYNGNIKKANPQISNDSTGTILIGETAMNLNYTICFPWLALCSGKYLSGRTNNLILPLIGPRDPRAQKQDYRVLAHLDLLDDRPRLPVTAIYSFESVIDGVDPRRPRFKMGKLTETNFYYHASSFFETNHVKAPRDAIVLNYDGVNGLTCKAIIKVESIEVPGTRAPEKPVVIGQGIFIDKRFHADQTPMTVEYFSTNWLSKDDAYRFYATALKKKPIADEIRKAQSAEPQSLTITLIVCGFLLTPVLVLVFSKLNQPRKDNQNALP